jgi:hypothetical protein
MGTTGADRIEFAADSPVEESGFEPPVPLAPKNGSDAGERDEQIGMSRRIDTQSLERLVTAHTVLRGFVVRRRGGGRRVGAPKTVSVASKWDQRFAFTSLNRSARRVAPCLRYESDPGLVHDGKR